MRDGRNWTYLHPLAQGKWNGSEKTDLCGYGGDVASVPTSFLSGEKHVLLYSRTEGNVTREVGKGSIRAHPPLPLRKAKGVCLAHGSYYAMKSMVRTPRAVAFSGDGRRKRERPTEYKLPDGRVRWHCLARAFTGLKDRAAHGCSAGVCNAG